MVDNQNVFSRVSTVGKTYRAPVGLEGRMSASEKTEEEDVDVKDWALERARELWNVRGKPKTLTHFTKEEYKESILSSNEIYARRLEGVQHDEDRMEWRLGWSILRTVVEGVAEDRDTSEWFEAVAEEFEEDDGPFERVYYANVACFTESSDLERTRQRFEEDDKEARIDFDVEKQIEPMIESDKNRKLGVQLWPVVYDIDHLIDVGRRVTEGVIQKIERQAQKNRGLHDNTLVNRAFYALRTPFTYMGLSYKRPRYRVEGEWRLIATGITSEDNEKIPEKVPLSFPSRDMSQG